MGDFVGGTLKYLRRHPIPRLTLAGGIAKFTKLALGAMDLHSKRSQVDFAELKDWLERHESARGRGGRCKYGFGSLRNARPAVRRTRRKAGAGAGEFRTDRCARRSRGAGVRQGGQGFSRSRISACVLVNVLVIGGTAEANALCDGLRARGIRYLLSRAGALRDMPRNGTPCPGWWIWWSGWTRRFSWPRVFFPAGSRVPPLCRAHRGQRRGGRSAVRKPVLRVERPPWVPGDDSLWHQFGTTQEIARALPSGSRTLVAIGRRGSMRFEPGLTCGSRGALWNPPGHRCGVSRSSPAFYLGRRGSRADGDPPDRLPRRQELWRRIWLCQDRCRGAAPNWPLSASATATSAMPVSRVR